MAPAKALAQLALQKRLLLAESGARRIVLAAEMTHLSRPVYWLDRMGHRARPLVLNGFPLVAYLLTRRAKGVARWVAPGFGALRVISSLRNRFRRPAAAS